MDNDLKLQLDAQMQIFHSFHTEPEPLCKLCQELGFCDRCEKPLTKNDSYSFSDTSYCGNCIGEMEAHAEAAWEAKQEEKV